MPATVSEGYLPGCIGRIAALHATYYSVTSGFGVAFEALVATELSEFCLTYEAGRDGLWLARDPEVEGSIVIDGSKAHEGHAHLRWFIVSEASRGRGIGRRLLQQALAFADDRQYGTVSLWTFAGLAAARHLYEEFGFRLVHECPGSRWGAVVTEQRFERRTG